ncbi:odorant receptor Or2-like [Wyeomyia smithii]|uniref:odorant receptor Or2-like n=1 Tax=Wyeomyia smithii TaxID=174621 RepID=UPI00246814E8|nr:odorant receptor Or2-like [Wyeomyia smithii]
MDLLTCPIISVDVRVWRFRSFILRHNAMRYICIIPVGLMNVFLCINIYQTWGNLVEMIFDTFYDVFSPIRLYLSCATVPFLGNVASVYEELQTIDDRVVQSLIASLTRKARKLSIGNLSASIIVCTCYVVYPLLTSNRRLPHNMDIPGVNVLDSPQYEILYIIQGLLTIPACCMYLPFTNIFSSVTLFGLIQIKTLQHQLATFKVTTSESLNTTVNKFIEDHLRIITYVEDINALVANICFVEFVLFVMLLCASLFFLNIIKSQFQMVIILVYIFMIVVQVFVFYWHANEVREASKEIANAAYDGPWYEADQSIKKNHKKLLLIALRAQRPLEVTLGNVYSMTLEMFQTLLKVSYTYFTVLGQISD